MAPSNYFHKPELALRRAIELQGIYQTDAALELLHDVLSSRRHRTWSLIYEQIMITYIDLCCLSKNKSREVKDGLHQYRNLCQINAPGSLEKVILYLLNKAELACTQAKAYVDDAELFNKGASTISSSVPTITDTTTPDPEVETNDTRNEDNIADTVAPVGDDDEDDDGAMDGFSASPQAILLLSTIAIDPTATTSNTKQSTRDTTTNSILLPSLKFLWEIYRAVLDILRSNSKLEHVYHITAQSALKFCKTYYRKMEFRHLCDMLRMHLGNLRQFGSNITNQENEDGTKSSHKVCSCCSD
jgi:translation initiation factor 3 subunit A